MAVVAIASAAHAATPARSPGLARQALDARLDEPEPREPGPRLEARRDVGDRDLREHLIGLLPGETLEDVVRTIADKKVQFRLSSDRALVVVRLPIG